MHRTLFSKYLTAFMLIIVAAFTVLILIMNSMISGYTEDMNGEVLKRTAVSAKEYIEEKYAAVDENNFNRYIYYYGDDIRHTLSTLALLSDGTFLFVTDSFGTVLLSGSDSASLAAGSVLDETVMESFSEDGTMLRLSDSLGGMLQGDHYIYSVKLEADGEPVGAVFVCTDSGVFNVFVDTMIKTLVTECLWVMLAALITVYFISEKITKPLKKISMAAKSFAEGQLDVRVPVIGHDEVADLAAAFNNMAGSLAGTEEMRRTFLANVSHDLRTPMTTIAGFIDGILDGAIPPDKHEYYLGIIASEVRRLSRLVTTLLDITRIQAGERKFNMERFDICEMARLILISFEQRIDEKHLDVSFDCDSEKMYVSADRDAIYQILYNICDNAVKFSYEGGAYKISIFSKAGKVYVSVYNEGQGIDESDIEHVFDRFYKSDKSRGLDKTGTGLGLYIAKTIIDAHHEKIWVRSVSGKFCEFVFTLQYTHEPKEKEDKSRDEKFVNELDD